MDIVEQMKADLAASQQGDAPQQNVDVIDQMAADLKKVQSAQQTPETKKSVTGTDYQNFMAGAGKAVVDLGRGVKQAIDIPAVWLESKFPGISKWAEAQGMPSAAQSANATTADINESRKIDAPLMDTKAGIAGNVAGNIAATMVPLGVASNLGVRGAGVALNPTTYGTAAAVGGITGALQPVAEGDNRLLNAGIGAAGGMAGNAIANSVGRIAQPVANILSTAHQKAVDVLDRAGIPLDAAQRTGSAMLNKLKSGLSDNPITVGGQAELAARQQLGFNKAVLQTVGENATEATPEVMGRASDRINGVFADILNRNSVRIEDPVLNRIGSIQSAALEEEKKPIAVMANRIVNAVQDDGSIPGQVAYGIKKDLDRLSSSSDTTLSYHARQLRSTLMDAITGSLSGEDQQAFNQARSQFSNLKKIESVIDRTGAGDISAPKLANVMAQKANRNNSVYGRGDQTLVDLANSGNLLLRDRNPNSGTVSRIMNQLALPALFAGANGLYEGNAEGVLKGAAVGAALPYATQKLINNPVTSRYLTEGMTGKLSPLREMLLSPQTSQTIGGIVRRLPLASYQSGKQ